MRNVPSVLGSIALALAVGLTSCTPIQSSPTANPADHASSFGGAGGYGSNSLPATPSSAGTVVGGTIDSSQSQGLSDYLKHHQLPLVGAQVVTSASGGRQAILFGFVASDFGKSDAEQKARNYLKDPSLVVDNRIKVSPELANSKGGSTPNPAPSYQSPGGADPYASTGSVQDYQNNLPPDAYAYQQQGAAQGQYQQYGQYGGGSGSSSGLMMMMGLLGMFGGSGVSMGSGGVGGGSYSGFSSGTRTYGGYPSYPSSPPPSPYYGP